MAQSHVAFTLSCRHVAGSGCGEPWAVPLPMLRVLRHRLCPPKAAKRGFFAEGRARTKLKEAIAIVGRSDVAMEQKALARGAGGGGSLGVCVWGSATGVL